MNSSMKKIISLILSMTLVFGGMPTFALSAFKDSGTLMVMDSGDWQGTQFEITSKINGAWASTSTVTTGDQIELTMTVTDAGGVDITSDLEYAWTLPTSAVNPDGSTNTNVCTSTVYTTTPGEHQFDVLITDPDSGRTLTKTWLVTIVQSPTGVTITPNSDQILNPGGMIQFAAGIKPIGAVGTVAWNSSNTSVATITTIGKLTAVGVGETTITCTVNGKFPTTVKVTVSAVVTYAQSMTLSRTTLPLNVGETGDLTATVTPTGATVQGTWTIQDPTVATVTGVGNVAKVQGLKPGTTTITYKISNSATTFIEQTASVTVTAVSVTGVTISGAPTAPMLAGATAALTAAVQPDNATDKGVSWSSSKANVAAITSAGQLTAKGAGTAEIAAASVSNPAVSGKASVIVQVPLTGKLSYADGTPAASRTITVTGNDGQGTFSVTTDATGKFTHPKLSQGNYTVTSTSGTVGNDNLNIAQTVAEGSTAVSWDLKYPALTIPVTSVTISGAPTVPILAGATVALTTAVKPNNATDKTVTWASTKAAVAAVSTAGQLTAKGAGTAEITAASVSNPTVAVKSAVTVQVPLTGKLSYVDGTPATYRTIAVANSNGQRVFSVTTDRDGKFTYPNISQGSYTITSNPSATGNDLLETTQTVAEGSAAAHWDLKYPKIENDGIFTIQFKDANGKIVPGVNTSMYAYTPSYQTWSIVSDSQAGKAIYEDLNVSTAGITYNYNYSTTDGQRGSGSFLLKTAQKEKTITINLPVVVALTGTVKTPSGKGVPGVCVYASGPNSLSGYTNADGQYFLRGALSGSYTVYPKADSKYKIVGQSSQTVDTSKITNIKPANFVVTEGLTVTGKVTLDGRTDNFSKAAVYLAKQNGSAITSGYAYSDGFGFSGAIKEAGTYQLYINFMYDKYGNYWTNYESAPIKFTITEAMLSQPQVTFDIPAFTKMKTSEIFRGDGNSLTANVSSVHPGGYIDFTGKFKNNGNSTVTATFKTTFTGVYVRSELKPELREEEKTVTLKPGESGRFFIRTKAQTKIGMVTATTTVTINGATYDFAKTSVEMLSATLFTATNNIKPNTAFTVYGEAPAGSIISIINLETGEVLGVMQMVPGGGKYYTVSIPNGFNQAGKYNIYAQAVLGNEVVLSDELIITVEAKPIEIKTVQIDGIYYSDLPKNSHTGVRTYSHSLYSNMAPFPMKVRSTFTNPDTISSVVYHFAGNDFTATKDSYSKWYADASNWRGTGIQRLTATLKTTDGRKIELLLAEAIILVDPSGYITDADTGLPLAEAEAECLQKQEDNSWIRLDTAGLGQSANPWRTGDDGRYGWDVPDGTYKISVTRDGYEPNTSDIIEKYKDGIEVPLPALDVNIAMIPATAMKLESLTSSANRIEALFSRHLDRVTVSVKDPQGSVVAVDVVIQDNLVLITGPALKNGVEYTVTFQEVTPKTGKEENYILKTVSANVVFSGQADAAIRVEIGSNLEDLAGKVSAVGAAPAGSVLHVKQTGLWDLPATITLNSGATPVFLDFTLVHQGAVVQPTGKITITLPVMNGLDINKPILVIHYNADGSVKEIVKSSTNTAKQTFTFTVSSFSPFGFVNGSVPEPKPDPVPDKVTFSTSSGSSGGGSYQSGQTFYNNEMHLRDGDIVYSRVLHDIAGTDELYTVIYNGKTYTFNGKNLRKPQDGVIYYSAREFMEMISKITSTKAGENTVYNPETGGIGIDLTLDAVQRTTALTPELQQGATETPELSMTAEETPVPQSAENSSVSVLLVILSLLAVIGGVWFVRKKEQQ